MPTATCYLVSVTQRTTRCPASNAMLYHRRLRLPYVLAKLCRRGSASTCTIHALQGRARRAPSSQLSTTSSSLRSRSRAPLRQIRQHEHVKTGYQHQEKRRQWRIDHPGQGFAQGHRDEVSDDGRRKDDRQPTVSLPNPLAHANLLRGGLHILREHHERASIIFQALPDGSRKLASTPPKRAIGSCTNSTPLARRLS